MNMLRAWIDSLSIFAPKNFKLFALVTLKTIIDGYKIMLRYWGWLYALLIVVWVYDADFLYESVTRFSYGFDFFTRGIYLYAHMREAIIGTLLAIISFALPFLFILSVRPSVKQKNYTYFVRYLPLLGYVYLVSSTLIFILRLSERLVVYDIPLGLIASVLLFIGRFPLPLITFFVFFLVDSDKKILSVLFSLYRSIKMVIYNYPLCWLILLLGWPIIFVLNWMGQIHMIHIVVTLLNQDLLLGTSLYIGIWSNIYIKKLHEQSNVYFTEPS